MSQQHQGNNTATTATRHVSLNTELPKTSPASSWAVYNLRSEMLRPKHACRGVSQLWGTKTGFILNWPLGKSASSYRKWNRKEEVFLLQSSWRLRAVKGDSWRELRILCVCARTHALGLQITCFLCSKALGGTSELGLIKGRLWTQTPSPKSQHSFMLCTYIHTQDEQVLVSPLRNCLRKFYKMGFSNCVVDITLKCYNLWNPI